MHYLEGVRELPRLPRFVTRAVGRLSPGQRSALRTSLLVFAASRLFVVVVGGLAMLAFGADDGDADKIPALNEPFGRLGDLLVATSSRWDSGHYEKIATQGYVGDPMRAAFFPLYPLLIHSARPFSGAVVASGTGATLVTGVLVSCVAFVVALYLLHRLVALDFGDSVARRAVILVAIFPTALFFSAVYTEALFLCLSVGAVYAARRGVWTLAGLAGGLAAATRPPGALLLVPLILLLLYGPREDRPRAAKRGWRPRYSPTPSEVASLLLVPLGLAAFCFYCLIVLDDPFASFHAQREGWNREIVLPIVGYAQGLSDFVGGLRNVRNGVSPLHEPGVRSALLDFGFLVFATVAVIGALRRLPAAYSIYALVAVALLLSSVPDVSSLSSFPRLVVVIFPLFIWLALWARTPGRWWPTVVISVALLAGYTTLFATLHWVA